MHEPARNLYRFMPDIEQDTAGLATYAYRTLGWRQAAAVAEYTPNGGARWPRSRPSSAPSEAPSIASGRPTEARSPPAPGTGLGRRRRRARRVRLRGSGSFHPRLCRAPPRRAALAAARALDVSASASCRVCGAVARPARCRRPASGCSRARVCPEPRVPQGVRAGVSRPAGERCEQPDRADVLRRAATRSCRPRETGGELGTERARLRAALDSLRLDSTSGPVRLDRNRQAVVPVTLGA